MSDDRFDGELDRIAATINPVRFENRAKERAVGPILADAARLLEAAVKDREDFEIIVQDREGDRQSAFLVHSDEKMTLVANIWLRAAETGLVIWAEEAPKSPFRVSNRHYPISPQEVTIDSVKGVLAQIASELSPRQ